MTNNQLIAKLKDEGYMYVRQTPTNGLVGLYRFIFTCAIVCNLDNTGYSHRYCYPDLLQAASALSDWSHRDYQGEPTGYIKRKPEQE